ncbi:putative Cytochrome P450 monooxygenase [Bradyrhizobium sp. STM 3843]|uniref:cytochrome P450 n=1 Tax=Bradyrhizobium sp. STM 3843 TaxID=551947 RepID=UPI00024076A9|nr:cytochrome P450 [Bradyrhizobium sp. STM 3843]CCE06989.1 putative Cytochrome P450 monooxygenase [Bradyrhizobium sp. STM 3843]
MSTAPQIDIDVAAFWADPYPALARMRREAPIAFVPQLGSTLLCSRDDIFVSEKQIDVFSSHQPGGLMNRLMGHNMMRKDGEAHMAERKAIAPAVSPKAVRLHWLQQFQAHADRLIDAMDPSEDVDLVRDFAMPFSAECLKLITGLTNMRFQDMNAWSQAMIDGIANYTGDGAVEARCHAATAGIDAAIDEMLPVLTKTPDASLLGVMLASGMPIESVRANIKLAISGGQNEPRDAIAGTVWALLTHPDQLALAREGYVPWIQAFEEYARWISPIGMSPRRIAKPWIIRDVAFAPEERVFLMFGSANRDETHFADPDRFDIRRDTSKSIAFGAGPHFCAGAWASRAMIADVALPTLFARLKNLRISETEPVRIGGWAFRGLLNLPVTWDASRN